MINDKYTDKIDTNNQEGFYDHAKIWNIIQQAGQTPPFTQNHNEAEKSSEAMNTIVNILGDI